MNGDDGRLQLRAVLQTKLGVPSRVEVWCGPELLGFITASSDRRLILTPADGSRLHVDNLTAAGVNALAVRFALPARET
jgi:hypothetical protein